METLILTFKSKKNYKLIKELAALLEENQQNLSLKENQKLQSIRKSRTDAEVRALASIAKGQRISKGHHKDYWLEKAAGESKKKLSRGKFKSVEEFMRFAGSMHGFLISKGHIRNISWKRRD
jgi:plasmid replication initiation protein